MVKIRAFILLLIFAFPVFGSSVEIHYCNGELTDTAIIGETECCCIKHEVKSTEKSCHEGLKMACHPDEEQEGIQNIEKDCCETAFVDVSLSTQVNLKNITFSPLVIYHAVFNHTIFFSPISVEQCFKDYQPPRLITDFSVQFQTFLI